MLELLESLRGVAPLMLIGQRVYVDTDAHLALQPLPPAEAGELLRRLGLEPDATTFRRVSNFTEGNPRLLELYAALRHAGEEVGDVWRLPRKSAAGPLFNRLWRRLDDQQRNSWLHCRSTVPLCRAASGPATTAAADLIARGLIKSDLAGGIALLPFTRQLVYVTLNGDRRAQLHHAAAHVRAQHGELHRRRPPLPDGRRTGRGGGNLVCPSG